MRYAQFLVYKEICTKRPKGNLEPNQDRNKTHLRDRDPNGTRKSGVPIQILKTPF